MKYKLNRLLVFEVIAVWKALLSCKNNNPELPVQETITLKTIENEHHAFGEGLTQSVEGTFDFPVDPERVEKIEMYIQLHCPENGCNEWDVFSNISVWDPEMDEWLEMGRYNTPYGIDNSQVGRGFMIDVTDFRSLLTGSAELRSFIEVWGSDGWLVSVEFEVREGEPEFKFSNITPVIHYADLSLGGIPYEEAYEMSTSATVTLSEQSSKTTHRKIISGWGHTTLADPDARACAEWCFRTYRMHINDQHWFTHQMEGLDCVKDPVQPQGGNWERDRAGWCLGKAVPVRLNWFINQL
ncbi:MAG: peptidase [Bacteroidota bacterium]